MLLVLVHAEYILMQNMYSCRICTHAEYVLMQNMYGWIGLLVATLAELVHTLQFVSHFACICAYTYMYVLHA